MKQKEKNLIEQTTKSIRQHSTGIHDKNSADGINGHSPDSAGNHYPLPPHPGENHSPTALTLLQEPLTQPPEVMPDLGDTASQVHFTMCSLAGVAVHKHHPNLDDSTGGQKSSPVVLTYRDSPEGNPGKVVSGVWLIFNTTTV